MNGATDVNRVVPVLQARALEAGYHGHGIVTDLELEVRPGEVVALVGPNGAGKSTTLQTLAGYLPRISGEVLFQGAPAPRAAHRLARAGLAYVPADRSVFARLTTADNLRVSRGSRAAALALFPELEALLDRQAGKLSGGEQQMLSLARALGRSPKLLLADELSMGLAPLVVTRLLDAVRAVADNDRVGVLLVEQHVQQALRVADRVYVLRRGSILMSGTADEVRPKLHAAYL
jgi:branched-chain amino acid transport system ATP-binding protein